ncbi:MAG TPA: HAD-IC family P-type ATPase, partial [Candidatus Dormibacteraeota bacterium]|nr:HAD-IC family P-type ATPase [Candidatus Dormibacteraeota bacterium]
MLIADFGTGVRVSVPTAVLATMIAGAQAGVLFKRGQAIEALAAVDTFVFDKTGTLTEGRPVVVGVAPLNGFRQDECLRLAGSAEGHLPHPLARAIRKAARRRGLRLSAPQEVRYVPGGGVRARVDDREVLVGDQRFLESAGVALPSDATSDASYVAADRSVVGRIDVRDRVKSSAAEAMTRLRAAGIGRLVLATGDGAAAARAVAASLGLDECAAEVMPEAKASLVRRLRSEGRRVAVIGDGMNDAGALVEADVGVSVPRGADLARETADVTLLSEDLGTLVSAVELSRSAMRLVRQNIGLVALPNGVVLALALLGRVSPLTA